MEYSITTSDLEQMTFFSLSTVVCPESKKLPVSVKAQSLNNRLDHNTHLQQI